MSGVGAVVEGGGGVEAVTIREEKEKVEVVEGGQVTGGLTTRLELLPYTPVSG
jgi:hypothetical protein